jgi:putative transposase
MNHKKPRRPYRRLQVRRRGGRKRALGARASMALPQGPNQRWSLDFLSDAMIDSRHFHILAVVDDYSRANAWFWSSIRPRGRPAIIVSDNGTELTSMTMLR